MGNTENKPKRLVVRNLPEGFLRHLADRIMERCEPCSGNIHLSSSDLQLEYWDDDNDVAYKYDLDFYVSYFEDYDDTDGRLTPKGGDWQVEEADGWISKWSYDEDTDEETLLAGVEIKPGDKSLAWEIDL